MLEFQTRKNDINQTRIHEVTDSSRALEPGKIRVKVEKFAFTANNITYAVAGEQMAYWRFFPAADDDGSTWGVMPVWGFGQVIETATPEIELGERFYGYFPPASEVILTPTKISARRFTEGAPNRADLAAAYNNYQRLGADTNNDGAGESERMLLAPLFTTSFCLWDSLADQQWRGGKQIVIISASSKTSIGLSYALAADPNAPAVIGLTSPSNMALVEKLGTYDKAVSYDQLESIDASVPTVIVDMSGNTDVLGRLHAHLGDNMVFCSNVGVTHWGETGKNPDINVERSEFFFAPGHIQKRVGEWGAAAFDQKVNDFMADTSAKCRDWLKIQDVDGLSGMEAVYDDVCSGKLSADQGIIVRM